jgi:type II/III secretion system protein
MRNLLLLFVCSLVMSSTSVLAADANLVLRLFHLQPSFIEIIREEQDIHPYVEISGDKSPETTREINWMDFLRKYGLTFPPGSYLRHSEKQYLLTHFNTENNQKLLGELVANEGCIPAQVVLDALFVDFSNEEIEKLARANTSPFPRSGDLLKLWRDGGGSLLHALKLITRSGVNAQVQAVSEYIYATEFREAATNNTQSPLPVPDMFTTREVGAIFNVTPTVGPDNQTIDVVLAPELTAKPEWTHSSVTATYAGGEEIQLSVPQPLFHSCNITTSVIVQDGETAVLGGMENPAGDGFTYLFLTVTLIDASGQPLKEYAGDTPP